MNKIIEQLRIELKSNADARYAESLQRFFKERIICHGVRSAIVRKIATNFFAKIRSGDKRDIFALCEELLQSDYIEEKGVAFLWASRLSKKYEPADFKKFEAWLKRYVANWGECDSFCGGALGQFITQFPQFLKSTKLWAKSQNRWVRRASAVAMILPNRQGKYLDESFEIADILLQDADDMVQKGYGWMLKEISNKHPQRVFEYVMRHKAVMPRTALRYAIEKLPTDMRKKAMER